jgi:predicted Zn-dependent protease
MGDTTYRIVLAARRAGGDLDRAFRQTLDSLRAVAAEEARDLRPLRLRVVQARDGDTPEVLAGRMSGVDRPLERFRTLNGLARGAPLKAGELYKVITE